MYGESDKLVQAPISFLDLMNALCTLAARTHKAFVKARKEIGSWTNLSDSPYISQRNRALGIS